ncbi:MAG: 16S rRNA (guanine(527)-N(7))-methyltransferase RsmG [Methylococcales bacterium]|nr:16S rRNA (guanine(527)-N(7))-methyltransferase RsmG [Methylococcales bacterium]
MESCKKSLLTGLEALNISLEEHKIAQLLAFVQLLEKWNKAYNLTAIRNKEAMIGLHLLDSLAVAPYIQGPRIIDIGTGAGLPGIPLAIYYPEMQFTLLDSNAKKTRFVQQAILELGLKNISVCHTRVEQYQPEQNFDTVITRAFASLPDILQLTTRLLSDSGILLAMKGQATDVPEIENAQTTIIPIQVPDVDAERCLVKIQLTK